MYAVNVTSLNYNYKNHNELLKRKENTDMLVHSY